MTIQSVNGRKDWYIASQKYNDKNLFAIANTREKALKDLIDQFFYEWCKINIPF